MNTLEQLQARNAELERERDELAAHNERYRVFVERFCEKVPDTPETHWIYPSVQVLKRATRYTPKTSLAEHDAEVAQGAYYDGMLDSNPEINPQWAIEQANKYAQRNYGVKGIK